MTEKEKKEFIRLCGILQREIHSTAVQKGWWAERRGIADAQGTPEMEEAALVQVDIACAGLVVTEIAEAIEGIRHGNPPDDKIPEHSSTEAEYADAIIRMFDHAGEWDWKLGAAIIAKIEYNKTRSYKHGKKA